MADQQYTQGEYVTRFNHAALSMDVHDAYIIKSYAIMIAEDKKIKQGKRKANRGSYTITFTKEIWAEAYKQHADGN